jgi:hypothetical protein
MPPYSFFGADDAAGCRDASNGPAIAYPPALHEDPYAASLHRHFMNALGKSMVDR